MSRLVDHRAGPDAQLQPPSQQQQQQQQQQPNNHHGHQDQQQPHMSEQREQQHGQQQDQQINHKEQRPPDQQHAHQAQLQELQHYQQQHIQSHQQGGEVVRAKRAALRYERLRGASGGAEASCSSCVLPFSLVALLVGAVDTAVACVLSPRDSVVTLLGVALLALGAGLLAAVAACRVARRRAVEKGGLGLGTGTPTASLVVV